MTAEQCGPVGIFFEEGAPGAGKNGEGPVFINADTYQACYLNLILPKGFKIEVDESVFKNM